MIRVQPNTQLGIGIYTTAQAAKYARIPTAMLSRWVHGTSNSEPALRAELLGDEDRLVTFNDLVQAMAIRSIRNENRHRGLGALSLQKIRKVVSIANDEYEIEYPFAMRHLTYLFEDEIGLHLIDQDVDIQITGKYANHYLINQVVEQYAEDLVYGEDNYASKFTAFEYRDRTVELDPNIRFGEPMIYHLGEPCGMSADELANGVRTEGGVEAAAEAYGVDQDDVRIALRYEDCHQTL